MMGNFSWTQPICERDWIKQRSEDDGIEIPFRLKSEVTEVERCSYCGEPTIFGVFVRADPATVPYPQPKDAA